MVEKTVQSVDFNNTNMEYFCIVNNHNDEIEFSAWSENECLNYFSKKYLSGKLTKDEILEEMKILSDIRLMKGSLPEFVEVKQYAAKMYYDDTVVITIVNEKDLCPYDMGGDILFTHGILKTGDVVYPISVNIRSNSPDFESLHHGAFDTFPEAVACVEELTNLTIKKESFPISFKEEFYDTTYYIELWKATY